MSKTSTLLLSLSCLVAAACGGADAPEAERSTPSAQSLRSAAASAVSLGAAASYAILGGPTFAVSGGFKHGGLAGKLEYDAHGKGGVKAKSTGVTQYLVVDAVTRHLEGTAVVNGVPGFTYQVDVSDRGEPGRRDTFSLRLFNKAGAQAYRASNVLAGGNIQLHGQSHGDDCDEGDEDEGHHDDDDGHQ